MSNKSRRRASTSRRRLTLAAGALLAGAAIPIAAAGTAWADETQTVGQLEHEGLSASEAKAVYNAEQPAATAKDPTGGTPVQVSYDGTTVVNANNPSAAATADSGTGPHDVAAAIGGGSNAYDAEGDAHDVAFANGGGHAVINDASDSNATATGGSTAYIDANGLPARGETHDRVVADGFQSYAYLNNASDSKATATDGGTAYINLKVDSASVDTRDVVSASGAGSGADIYEASGSSNVVNNGNSYTIYTNDTHEVNGMVVPHVEMTPLNEVHMMPPTPLP
jgi:hypothetical protein